MTSDTSAPAHLPLHRGLLPPGLRTLIRLRYKAVIRRMVFGSAKRRLFTILGLCLMAVYVLPNLLAARKPFLTADGLRDWLPIFLIFFTAIQLFARSRRDPMTFQPAEIDLVVPGPFSRRQLVLYQIVYQVGPLIVMGLWMGIFLRTGGGYLCTALGAALLFFGINLLAGIINSSIGFLNAKSRFIVPAVLALIGLALVLAVRSAPPHPQVPDPKEWLAWATAIRHTPIIESLCLPARPFVETFVSTSIFRALPWAFIAITMNIGLIALFIALDRGEVEALVTQSQERLARREKANRALSGLRNPEKAASRQIPMLPRLGGAGPLLWRQATMLYRGAGPIVTILAPLVLLGGTFALGRSTPPDGLIPIMISSGIFCCLGLSLALKCDFRSDLDHMELLKTIPIAPVTIVLGQIAAPILLAAIMQTLIAIGLALGAGALRSALIGCLIGAATIPLSAVLVAIENTVFLIAPTRPLKSAMQSGFDPAAMGRTVLINISKLLVVLGAAAIIGLPAWGVYELAGAVPAAIVGVLIALGLLYGLFMACAKAFTAFNLADDLPA